MSVSLNGVTITIALMILILLLMSFVAIVLYRADKQEIEIIRKFIDQYGYDGQNNEEIAKTIHKEIKHGMELGMNYEEFKRLADRTTDPYLDPAKINP